MPEYIPPPQILSPGVQVWAYLRDSGGREQEQSVIQQRADITTYCEKYGLILDRVFSDVARSGGSTKGRDQFTTMIDMAADPNTRPAGLLVWNLSRFSRDVDDAAFYKAFLRRLGVVIHSLTDHIPEGLAGRILESVKDYSNADYLDQLKIQIKRALETNVRAGYAEGGYPPRGYLAEKVIIGRKRDGNPRIVSRWIPDPELFPLAVLAWKLRAQGKPYAEITKATGGRLYQNSGCWTSFFGNETYRGIGKCGDVKIPDHHESAVSQEDWQKVQELRHSRAALMEGMTNPRRARYPSLLSGLARCIHCGAAMVHHHRGGKWKKSTYYICGQRDRKHGVQVCEGRRLNAHKVDAAILEAMLSRVLTPAFLEEIFEEARLQLTDSATLGDEIKRKREVLRPITQAIRNLLDLAETFGSEAARARLKERETEQAILKAEIKSLEIRQANANIDISPEALQIALETWTNSFAGLNTTGNTATLRSFLARFISKVELGYNQARIHYTFPLDAINPTILYLSRGIF